jgi:hypothetical protein
MFQEQALDSITSGMFGPCAQSKVPWDTACWNRNRLPREGWFLKPPHTAVLCSSIHSTREIERDALLSRTQQQRTITYRLRASLLLKA